MSVPAASLLAAAAVAVLLAPGPGTLRVRAVSAGEDRRPDVGCPPPVGPWRREAILGGTDGVRGQRARPLMGAVAAAGAALALGFGPVAAGLAAAGVAVAARWWRRRELARERERERSRAMQACSALAGELRAGRSAAQSLEVAAGLACGPSRTALLAAAAAAGMGGDVAGALRPALHTGGCVAGGQRRDVGAGTAVPEVLRALAACWSVCASSGSGLAVAVERLEQGLRADQEQRRAVQAELAGPRATAGVLAILPLAGLALAGVLGADPLHVLFETPVGLVCLLIGLGLDGLGVLWTGRMVARAGGTG